MSHDCFPIPKCENCERFDKVNMRMKNKLRCIFGGCDEYTEEATRRAFEYNKAVSGENFDTEEIYEHGNKVFGSGWNKGSDSE